MTATGGCCIHGVAYGPGWSCAQCSAAMSEDQRKPGLWIVLDGPPGPVAGRFVDIEDDHERSVGLSGLEWRAEGWVWAIGPFCLRGQLDAAEERLAEAEATIVRVPQGWWLEAEAKAARLRVQIEAADARIAELGARLLDRSWLPIPEIDRLRRIELLARRVSEWYGYATQKGAWSDAQGMDAGLLDELDAELGELYAATHPEEADR